MSSPFGDKIYRFTSPEGSFYPPIVLCADEGQLVKTGDLTATAAEAALIAARHTP